jgi:hypothetical protein
MRVLAGCSLVSVNASDWLVVCTISISLFLGFSKRRQELLLVGNTEMTSRQGLKEYDVTLLDQMMAIASSACLVSYILYTLSEETVVKFGTRNLILTSPFVMYGIFRYLYLIYQKKERSDITEILLSDVPLMVNGLLWAGTVLIIIYGR